MRKGFDKKETELEKYMITISNLNKTYDRKSRHENHVLRNVSLTLPDTGFVCIIGASGCGKTSLLNVVGGLDTFDSGTISVGNMSVSKPGSRRYEQERNNSFSYIFQNYYLLSDHSVAYNVYLGLHALALTHGERLERVREALEAVNMSRYAGRIVGELSGGQQQRVAIARALARRPRVIFADEPTGNLDEENTLNICTILRRVSKTSLVVMVTHEERIANFFADRIITLGEGKVVEDVESWQREKLAAGSGNALYTEDYTSSEYSSGDVHIRVLTEENAEPVRLTIAVLKNKIVIKTDDGRGVSCSKNEEAPFVKEGKSPVLTLESMDNAPQGEEVFLTEQGENAPARAGAGFPLVMMLQEASRLLRGKGIRQVGTLLFLVAMTVLMMLVIGDYLTISSIDPRDFVTRDSHVIELSVERGEELDPKLPGGVVSLMPEFLDKLIASEVDLDLLPYVTATKASFTFHTFPQVSEISVNLENFSYAPLDRLDESTLIYGRMPENCEEIVVDRWVLEQAIGQDGILQNNIVNIQQLLGIELDYFRKNLSTEIVGICDSNNPTIYMSQAALISVGNMGTEVVGYSEFISRYPEAYGGEALTGDQCIVVVNNAGPAYKNKIGSIFVTNSTQVFRIIDAVESETHASIVVADETLDGMMRSMYNLDYCFYTQDKKGLSSSISEIMERDYKGLIIYRIKDVYGDNWEAYREAASLKADARTIVTITLIVLSMVMLYLLQRSLVQQRIGMVAVYLSLIHI